MDLLDTRAFFIFYFRALQIMLISLLIFIPVILIILAPLYFFSTYLGFTESVLTIIQVIMIFVLVYFSLFPPIWGYLAYFRYRIKIDSQGMHLEEGILFHHKDTILFSNIQTITIAKGSILELFGLCSVSIDYVFNTKKKTVNLAGLSVHKAQYVRNMYLENMKTAEQTL